MKLFVKRTLYIFVFILLAIVIYGWMNYAPDKSFAALKEKWAYDNSQFLEMEGMPVHYRINGKGTPLVLIHGTAASLHTWEAWTGILEKEYQVISLDLPAFGLTGPNKEGVYTLDYYAKFLDRFLEKIGIEKFSIAGNSLGGAIAWKYAFLFPEKVQNLILVNAGGFPMNKRPPLVFRIARNKTLSKVMKYITPKSMISKSVTDVYYNDELVNDSIIERYYDMTLRKGNRQAFVDRIKNIESDQSSEISKIKVPTLILWGKHDAWIPVENAYKFEEAINGSKLVIYENAGHIPMEEIPEQTANDTRKFLLENSPLPEELVIKEILQN